MVATLVYSVGMETSQRTHHDMEEQPLSAFCPRYHRAIELIGRRWMGAILRVLVGGPRRYNELLGAIPGISDRLLTERLRELESEGLAARQVQPGPPVQVWYALTEPGRDLEGAVRAVSTWAERWLTAPDPNPPCSPE